MVVGKVIVYLIVGAIAGTLADEVPLDVSMHGKSPHPLPAAGNDHSV
jgi:hypothetical protein